MSATATRRTGAPVRRQSRAVGRCEVGFWRPFDPRDVSRFMLAAERYERAHRERGKRSGPLGSVGIEVLRELLRLVDYRTGRLEPSLRCIMGRVKRSRDAVTRALSNLRQAGFLDWLRRWEPTGAKEGEGPPVKQASNAYRLMIPPAALRLLGSLAKPAPSPVDEEDRRAARVAEVRAMIDGLPLWEQGTATAGNNRLGAVLDRLGAAIAGCESAQRSESPSSNLRYGVGPKPDPFLSRRGR